jgi:pilus assembly protein CpaB
VANAASSAMDAAVKEPEGPKFKTVIVTRGLEQQSYQVVAPSK